MPSGTYTLLLEVPDPIEVTFGAAGNHELPAGWAAYTGSAFGPGGLTRVDRHREVALGERDVRHWHVDHLLGRDETSLEAVWATTGKRLECHVHAALPGREVPVGASDCDCEGQLRIASDRSRLAAALADIHARRLDPLDGGAEGREP